MLIENGAFADIDAAMMFHPYDRTILTNPALAHRGSSSARKLRH
jgi:metal-dependent amidase/aminoacylase/carboxypeptidase family protein